MARNSPDTRLKHQNHLLLTSLPIPYLFCCLLCSYLTRVTTRAPARPPPPAAAQIGSFVTGKLLSRFGFKAAFYMHAAFSVPTLLILLRFSPKKEDRGKEPPKFAELYRLVVHDVDVLVSG